MRSSVQEESVTLSADIIINKSILNKRHRQSYELLIHELSFCVCNSRWSWDSVADFLSVSPPGSTPPLSFCPRCLSERNTESLVLHNKQLDSCWIIGLLASAPPSVWLVFSVKSQQQGGLLFEWVKCGCVDMVTAFFQLALFWGHILERHLSTNKCWFWEGKK